MRIDNLTVPLTTKLTGSQEQSGDKAAGFKDLLEEALNNVNNNLIGAEKITQDFALGKEVELHQVILATEQASLALQLTVQIRNKVIEAYQEVMRMQV